MPYGGRMSAIERLSATVDESTLRELVSLEYLSSHVNHTSLDDGKLNNSEKSDSPLFLSSPGDDDRNLAHHGSPAKTARRLSSMLELDEDLMACAAMTPPKHPESAKQGLTSRLRRLTGAAATAWKRSSAQSPLRYPKLMNSSSGTSFEGTLPPHHIIDKKSRSETFSSRSHAYLGQSSSFAGESMYTSNASMSRDALDAHRIESMVIALGRY
jgi:hypothetical protein